MFRRRAGQPECGDHADQGQQRPHPDRQRGQKGSEFQHQHGVHEDEGRNQHERQVPERLLLLLVQAAEFEGRLRRQG